MDHSPQSPGTPTIGTRRTRSPRRVAGLVSRARTGCLLARARLRRSVRGMGPSRRDVHRPRRTRQLQHPPVRARDRQHGLAYDALGVGWIGAARGCAGGRPADLRRCGSDRRDQPLPRWRRIHHDLRPPGLRRRDHQPPRRAASGSTGHGSRLDGTRGRRGNADAALEGDRQPADSDRLERRRGTVGAGQGRVRGRDPGSDAVVGAGWRLRARSVRDGERSARPPADLAPCAPVNETRT